MYCFECGIELSDNLNFCPDCDTEQDQSYREEVPDEDEKAGLNSLEAIRSVGDAVTNGAVSNNEHDSIALPNKSLSHLPNVIARF